MKGETWKENYSKYRQQHRLIHDLELMSYVRKCSVCNKKFIKIDRTATDGDLSSYVEERKMCYECAFWSDFIEKPKPNGLQVVNGVCYLVLPFIEKPTIFMLLGGGGKKRFFVSKERKVFKSNDVWLIGTIPAQFRDKLPDTGWFCDRRVYGKLLSFNRMCKEIGCFDRYKCFRFRTELELQNGPFNTIPDDWITGGEHCGFFINTDLVENYSSPIKIETNEKGTEREND